MKECELLELIWSGAVASRDANSMSPLARVLDALLVVPTIALVSSGVHHHPVAMVEGNELLPGATLGDVLTEELGIHVPRDAIVLIEPVAMADATEVSGAGLGRDLGNILMSMASMPLESVVRHPGSPAVSDVTGRHLSQAARQSLTPDRRQRAVRG
jgi:hypothetical protein